MRKIGNTKNGYTITPDTTNEEWKSLCDVHKPVKCIICNENTSKHFRVRFLGSNIFTINNKLPDDVVYFNQIK